jgi:hypothetical protein
MFHKAVNNLHLHSTLLLLKCRNKTCGLPRHHAFVALNALFMQKEDKDRQQFLVWNQKTAPSGVDLPDSFIGFKRMKGIFRLEFI